MLTVRMTVGAQPFAIRVPKSTAKTFTGRGIVATFDPPKVGVTDSGAPQYAEFLVYNNVDSADFDAYVASEDQAERIELAKKFGKSTPASSPVSLHEAEFLSWQSIGRQTAGSLLASGVAAFEPARAGKTSEADILSAIDAAYALLGLDVPANEDADESEDEDEDTSEDEDGAE
jgi:hypothetical protein